MSTRLVLANGAQILPPIGDVRATVSAWEAISACGADQRAKSASHRDLAAKLIVIDDVDICGVRFYESDSERCTKPAGHSLEVHSNGHYAWGPALVVPERSEATLTGGLFDLLEDVAS